MSQRKINWNSLLLVIGFPVLGWLGRETYGEIKLTHDSLIEMRNRVVYKDAFEIQMSEIRSRLAIIDLEIQKLKDKQHY